MIGPVCSTPNSAAEPAPLEDRDDGAEGGERPTSRKPRAAFSGTRTERKTSISSRKARPTTSAQVRAAARR